MLHLTLGGGFVKFPKFWSQRKSYGEAYTLSTMSRIRSVTTNEHPEQ